MAFLFGSLFQILLYIWWRRKKEPFYFLVGEEEKSEAFNGEER
jgi:hypothetical protein